VESRNPPKLDEASLGFERRAHELRGSSTGRLALRLTPAHLHSCCTHPRSGVCAGKGGVTRMSEKVELAAGFCFRLPRFRTHLAAHSILSHSQTLVFERVLVMSLPFRFKAGGTGGTSNMASIHAGAHHHRSTTKQIQKPFKSRFASKSALKDLAKGFIFHCLV
jgi:hypothetical protein